MHKDFPSQPQGPNECTPGGVSNSLLWLKAQNGLTIPDEELSIAALAAALGTGPNGTPLDWPQLKDAYLKALAKKYPGNVVETTEIPGTGVEGIPEDIEKGADVEADLILPNGSGHTVAIVGIVPNADGTFTITFADDTDQGNPGGEQSTDTITVNGDGVVVTGCDGIPPGTRILRFVREVVKKTPMVAKSVGVPR